LNKKIKKKRENLGEMGFGLVGDKMGNLGILGGRRWVGTVEKGWRRCLGGGGGDGWRWVAWVWILGKRGTEEEVSGCMAGGKEMGKRGRESDLKPVHTGLKSSTFELP
jgi:hypothetical protein